MYSEMSASTNAHRSATPFSSAFRRARATAAADESTPTTLAAPPRAAETAKPPL